MRVYQITHECLIRDYHGAGRAWAAVADGVVVALRYMGDSPGCWADKPAWVAAVEQHATGLDAGLLPTCRGSKALAAMAEAAAACDDCPKPSRRPRYRPTELLSMARAALTAAHGAAFSKHRERCRTELGQFGDVVSGMCSATEFVA